MGIFKVTFNIHLVILLTLHLLFQDLSIIIMSDLSIKEIDLVEDPDEIHKIYRQSFIDEQEFYLYKYIGENRFHTGYKCYLLMCTYTQVKQITWNDL